jgi:hypothetical protein
MTGPGGQGTRHIRVIAFRASRPFGGMRWIGVGAFGGRVGTVGLVRQGETYSPASLAPGIIGRQAWLTSKAGRRDSTDSVARAADRGPIMAAPADMSSGGACEGASALSKGKEG